VRSAAEISEVQPQRTDHRQQSFVSLLPWIIIVCYVLWRTVFGPALMTARHSEQASVTIRNETSTEVYVIAVAPRSRDFVSTVVPAGAERFIVVTRGDGGDFWKQPVRVSAFDKDGRLVREWEGPAEQLASWQSILVVSLAGTDGGGP